MTMPKRHDGMTDEEIDRGIREIGDVIQYVSDPELNARLLAIVTAIAPACVKDAKKAESADAPDGGAAGDAATQDKLGKGPLLPWAVGNSWTKAQFAALLQYAKSKIYKGAAAVGG